jgi:chaperone required for assembly of F1-ATPase
MTGWAAKRFWREASAVEDAAGFAIALDGRLVRTPAKAPLVVPTRALARDIAAEWDAQDDKVRPETMPFTRTANSAIDKVAHQRAEVAAMLAEYGDSDLVCYRAEGPEGLVARQAQAWDPVLDWLAAQHGARLVPRSGVIHAAQDAQALQRLAERVHALDPFALAAFHDLVALTGSLALAFAAAEDWRDPGEIWDMSRIDEVWQEDHWGPDDDARATAALRRGAFLSAKAFWDALRATD